VVEVEPLAKPEEDNGWPVLATTVDAAGCPVLYPVAADKYRRLIHQPF
jgi:hypothetical protein